jgi:hypothetical protein
LNPEKSSGPVGGAVGWRHGRYARPASPCIPLVGASLSASGCARVHILCAYLAYRDYQRREQIGEKIQELGKALDSHEATLPAIPPLPAIEAPENEKN